MTFELLPLRAAFKPGEPLLLEVRDLPAPGELRVLHLGDPVATQAVASSGVVKLEALPPGGYGVELRCAGVEGSSEDLARTAIEIARAETPRMRYGFVVDYRPERDVDGVSELIRRLHLTDVQFYDWAYRHADLLGGGESYADALDQPITLASVRHLIGAVQGAGARALGYAAVYGIGNDEWDTWSHLALLSPTELPYSLGDFLRLIDPADPGWLDHFTSALREATARLGFDGFHLDQYGYPKHAARPDGALVALEDSFATLIDGARSALPGARLVFNNVNNFPTWRTGKTAQDAVYIEVWPPHTTLGHLAAVVRDAHVAGGGKPVVIAAYQHVYESAPVAAADLATAFTMATLFSHGATHLLAGEADRILTDPYYVRNHTVEAPTADLLKRWYDFVVEHGDLLFDASFSDVTGSYAGDYNGDCDVTYPASMVTETPVAGAVWRRVLGNDRRLVLHLINLASQDDTEWDSARNPIRFPRGELRMRRAGPGLPRVRMADPDRQARLIDLPVIEDGDYARVHLPSPNVWQMIVIDLETPLGTA
jgi:dextranase